MPYVRYMRGFGQGAPCPSTQQLMGITDMTDPCQNPVAGLPIGSGVSPALQAAVTPLAVAGAPNPFSNTSPSGMVSSSLPAWFVPLALGLGVVLVIGAMNRR